MMLKSNTQVATSVHANRANVKAAAGWKQDGLLTFALVILALLTYIPFVSVLVNSFKDNAQFFTQFWLPTFPLHFDNYSKAWPIISQSILNSLIYSIPTVTLVLIISGLTGYAFARYRFWGRETIFLLMLILIMLPGILLVIPMFVEIKNFGWINTVQGIVFPWTAVQIPFGMFLMRTFFETLPREYFEAARLDGADELKLFYRIALPLATPAFSTLGILTLLFTWNDLIWPIITLLDSKRYPISIGVLAFSGSFSTDFGVTFAGYVLASVPLILVFVFTARRFMAGLQGGLSI
jgi:ABC-type glycerol-3-phosphate transport system permease component